MNSLDRAFYKHEDTLWIAKQLLGKFISTDFGGRRCEAKIVETEAYLAPEDQASHARNYRKTPRTQSFYENGGTAYVYISYGVHHLFNIITQDVGIPHAILIRAVEPISGIDIMKKRRGLQTVKKNLTGGPGMLTVAMGIRVHHDGIDLCNVKSPIQIIDSLDDVTSFVTSMGPRIGIDSVEEPWLSKPYRFWIQGNKWVSR